MSAKNKDTAEAIVRALGRLKAETIFPGHYIYSAKECECCWCRARRYLKAKKGGRRG